MFARRLSIITGATTAAVLLTSGTALAHGCYFTSPNEKADDNRAKSSGFMSVEDMVHTHLDPTLCDAGVRILAAAAGVTPDTLVNAHGMMAAGSGGNERIQHMDFDALFAAVGNASAACAPAPAL